MGRLCLCPSFLNSGLLLLTSVGLLSLTSFRNPILQAVGLECGLLRFINLKKFIFNVSYNLFSLPQLRPQGRALCIPLTVQSRTEGCLLWAAWAAERRN